MKRRHLSMIVALPVALAFACAASAQQTPSQTQPQPPPQTQMPQQQMQQMQQMRQQQMQPAVPTTTQTRQCAAGTNCYDNNTTDRDTHRMSHAAPKFSTLAGSKGYVTQADTSGHRWWANHFSRCDSNHDGKLTRSEYNACRTQH